MFRAVRQYGAERRHHHHTLVMTKGASIIHVQMLRAPPPTYENLGKHQEEPHQQLQPVIFGGFLIALTQNSPEMGSLSHRIRRKNEKEKKHGKSIIHPRRGGFVFPPTGPEAISFPSKKLTQDRHTKTWPTYYHNHIVNAYTVIVCIVESQFHGGEENCDIESELG